MTNADILFEFMKSEWIIYGIFKDPSFSLSFDTTLWLSMSTRKQITSYKTADSKGVLYLLFINPPLHKIETRIYANSSGTLKFYLKRKLSIISPCDATRWSSGPLVALC